MAKTIEFKRRLLKRSTISGEYPTIPGSNDHTDGTWLDTDIYEGELFYNVPDNILYTREDTNIIVINGIYTPETQPVVTTGDITFNCSGNVECIFRPRLSTGTRTINTNFDQLFTNDNNVKVIQAQFVFTGTIIISMPTGDVQVVEETLPSIYSWDSGLEQLTIEAGTDDKVELNYFRDPDDSGKYTLICGGVAV